MIFALFFLAFVQTCLSLKPVGYEIVDLDKSGAEFAAQATQWTDTGHLSEATSNVYNCNGLADLVGGYMVLNNYPGAYFQRLYTDLPEHNMIYYLFEFWLFDSWDLTDSFDIEFDSSVVDGWKFEAPNFLGGDICAQADWWDLPKLEIIGRTPHSSDSLTVRIVSQLNDGSWDESFGFRNVRLLLLNRTEVETSQSCGKTSVPLVAKECPCSVEFYTEYTSNSSCGVCSSFCASCFGPDPAACYQCVDGYSLIGQECIQCSEGCRSCHGPGPDECDVCESDKFHYWNNSCLDSCESPPLKQVFLSEEVKECVYPCSSSEYLYWDGVCLESCEDPLGQREEEGVLFCDFPCDADKFLYWDGSCLDTCSELLIQSTVQSRKLCNHPCTDPSEFLFSNATCQPSCPSPFDNRTEGPAKYCDSPCLQNQFYYWNSTCLDTCDFPLTSRTEGELNFCDYKCLSDPTTFLSWDGTCLGNCDPPLSQKIEGVVKFCYSPCSGDGFLYWDGFCSSYCPTPLTPRTVATTTETSRFCDFGCPSSTDFLYWDGSCSGSCPSPLVANIYHSRGFCIHPCGDPDDFIYWNNTCHSACPSPYKTRFEGLVKYCDLPCPDEQFLYWNGICNETCKTPLSVKVTAEVSFCEYLCDAEEYLFWNGSCITACDFPLIWSSSEEGYLFCNLPCSSPYEYYYEETGECRTECIPPNVIKTNDLYLSCGSFILPPVDTGFKGKEKVDTPEDDTNTTTPLTDAEGATGAITNTAILLDTMMAVPSDPTTLVLILYVKILQYVKYMDIHYPPELKTMLITKGNNRFILNFGPSVTPEIKSEFGSSSIPPVFQRYHLSSSFLVDFWQVMTTLGILLGFICLAVICEKVIDRFKLRSGRVVMDQLKLIFRWNFILIIFISNIDEIVLYSSLELGSLDLDSFLAVLSFLSAIIMLFLIPAIMAGSSHLSRTMKQKRDKALKEGSQVTYVKFAKKWQGFQVLWSGFKADTFLKQIFLSIYIGRIVIVYLIASNLYISPLVQAILYLVISIILLTYLAHQKPLKTKINQVQLYAYELIILTVNLSILLLAILDSTNSTAEQLRIFLGNIVIFCHLALNLIATSFLGIKIAMRVKKIHNLYKKNHKFGKRGCFQLFLLPLQQVTIGFENIKPLQGLNAPFRTNRNDKKKATSNSNKPRITSRFLEPLAFETQSSQNSNSSRKKLSITMTASHTMLDSDTHVRPHMKSPSIIMNNLSIDNFSRKMSFSEPNPEYLATLVTEDELLQAKRLYGSSGSIPPESPRNESSGSLHEDETKDHIDNASSSDILHHYSKDNHNLSSKDLDTPPKDFSLMKDQIPEKIIKDDKLTKRLKMLNVTDKLEEVDSHLEYSFKDQGRGESGFGNSQR